MLVNLGFFLFINYIYLLLLLLFLLLFKNMYFVTLDPQL